MRTILVVIGSLGIALGCRDSSREGQSSAAPQAETAATPTASRRDPCSLVSQVEIEKLIGPLGEAPYRVKDRWPDPSGDTCMYRAKDQRNVTVHVDWDEGQLYFDGFAAMGGKVEGALGTADFASDTLEGSWDDAATPFGQFIALKRPTAVHVDVLGSRLDLGGAAKIASIALGRAGAPLDYDGAAAARKHPPPTMRDPCSLVTRAEVEQLMGPLRADPEPSGDRKSCNFPLGGETPSSQFDRVLEVQWADGFYALGFERLSTGMATKVMRLDPGAGDPTLSANAAGEKEPWDERTTLIGGQVTVVKRDVMLKLVADGMDGFDEEKALGLLRMAARRL